MFEYHNGILKKNHIQTFIPFQFNDFLKQLLSLQEIFIIKMKTKSVVGFQKGFGLCMNIEYLVNKECKNFQFRNF